MALLSVSTLALAVALGAVAPQLPPGTRNVKVTLHLEDADVANVYRLVGDIGRMSVVLDACLAREKVSLRLKDVPLSMVLDAVDEKVGSTRTLEGGVLVEHCGGAPRDDDQSLDKRITVRMKSVKPADALAAVASLVNAGTAGVVDAAPITIDVEGVAVREVLATIGKAMGFDAVDFASGVLVPARAPAPAPKRDVAPGFDKKVTIELRQVGVANLYKLLGEITGSAISIPTCVEDKKVDLKLKNAPADLVMRVLDAKLGTTHVYGGGGAVVSCR